MTELPVSEELTTLSFRFTESIGGDKQHIARQIPSRIITR
jgi:hypothetical protein